MSKTLRKSLLYGLLLVIGITFGMQLAESGTSRIHSPVPARTSQRFDPVPSEAAGVPDRQQILWEGRTQVPADWTRTAAEANTTQPVITERVQTPDSLLLPPPEQAPVDRFADKAANLLQQVSQRSIYWVASWFNAE
ncbi:hypothetical protein [Paenibacillus lentus]|uniref:Uncharacterized protein n=1 Tax=Paenibacillus lentus TaxID=1338368 RepID=A0A3S8RV71_9BACL|nr:hypothetical protein [Paenibacillus lentus]AZK46802.1 hypothetical protein EIM92_12105 [Paenibacillus lentus]